MPTDHEKIDVFWHPDGLKHDTGRGLFDLPASPFLAITEPHPEGPERILNMKAILERGPLRDYVTWHEGRHATWAEILTFHHEAYLARLQAIRPSPLHPLSDTTVLSPDSLTAARAAAGTTLAALDHLLAGRGRWAYALVRPPGHHAAPAQEDGYCLFNNLGIAVETALRRGVGRVAVLDWDVHHGNGAQEGFYERADVLTISLHMDHDSWGPTHPQSGGVEELGRGPGLGYNLNIPLPMGSGNSGYDYAMTELVFPAIAAFAPDLLVIALGQDASQFDPNGRQLLNMAGFRQLGRRARALAEGYGHGRLLLVQEGGYAVGYAAYCLHATLEGVLGLAEPLLADPLGLYPEDPAPAKAAVAAIRRRWRPPPP
jgi:acetoin utilization deacetylase AcuC-like enzyme